MLLLLLFFLLSLQIMSFKLMSDQAAWKHQRDKPTLDDLLQVDRCLPLDTNPERFKFKVHMLYEIKTRVIMLLAAQFPLREASILNRGYNKYQFDFGEEDKRRARIDTLLKQVDLQSRIDIISMVCHQLNRENEGGRSRIGFKLFNGDEEKEHLCVRFYVTVDPLWICGEVS